MLKLAAFVLVPVALLFIAGASMGPSKDPKSKARWVIAECWRDYERKSLDDNAKRFVAGTCESLERRFRETHGVAP